jgi:hypothetical protein
MGLWLLASLWVSLPSIPFEAAEGFSSVHYLNLAMIIPAWLLCRLLWR